MTSKITVSVVSYLNSVPFVNGLKSSPIADEIDLQLDIPSVCAEKLLSGRVDIGLAPVAIIPQMSEYHIISDYCIGCDGGVRSVTLCSNVPLPEITAIALD